jgi:hypothetical protein
LENFADLTTFFSDFSATFPDHPAYHIEIIWGANGERVAPVAAVQAAFLPDGTELLSDIQGIETFARGPSVKQRKRLSKEFGKGKWRKVKGVALVRSPGGNIRWVELHWFEAHGIGKKEIKIKSKLD